jgi:hypothetical protein
MFLVVLIDLVILVCLTFLDKKKKLFKNFLLLNNVLKKNFLKKKLPLSGFLTRNNLNFFLFFSTTDNLLDIKVLTLSFFLKKRFFFLFTFFKNKRFSKNLNNIFLENL